MKSAYIVTSRSRARAIPRILEAWRATRQEADLLIAIDSDDPERQAYREELARARPGRWVELVEAPRPPRKHAGVLNHWAPRLAERYDIVGSLNDDHFPRTSGWDTELRTSLQRLGTGIAYANDTIKGERLPTSVALTADIIRALGFMAPPPLEHWYVDDFWLKLGRDLARITYRADVIIEHVHPHTGKVAWDPTYAEGSANVQDQRARWRKYLADDYADDLEKVRPLLRKPVRALRPWRPPEISRVAPTKTPGRK